MLQFKLEIPVEKKTTSCWEALCRCFKRGQHKDLHLRSYMKKTSNPDAPIKDEVQTLSKANSATLRKGGLNNSSVLPTQHLSYDFMNYPEAIPEEVFVYFGSQVDSLEDLKKVTQREIFLNLHFMRHYFSILEQREEKEVYLANGFT